MSASSLADLLARQLPRQLAEHARDLLAAQTALDRVLPAALCGRVRVMQLDAGTLALACDSGAVASRLRQQTGQLQADLARQGLAVATVRVGVNPDLLARYTPPVEKAGLPPTALAGLARLDASLEDGPLKEALDRLLRHHRKA
ncbi:MAG: DciA family protein [Thiobacillus sp.]